MPTNLKLSVAFVLLLMISLGAWRLLMHNPESPCEDRYEQLASRIVSGGPSTEGISPIDQPQFVSAEQAGLDDSERVLGMDLPGLTAAFPCSVLVWREIVNLELNGETLAVTYCPLTGAGMGFRGHQLGVSGRLLNSNLVAWDRKTESLLPQIPGVFISGPLCGERPAQFPLTACTWEDWRAAHPQTLALSRNTGYAWNNSEAAKRDPFAELAADDNVTFPLSARSDALAPRTIVLCFERGGEFLAVPKQDFTSRHPLGMQLRLGGVAETLTWDPVLKTISSESGLHGVEMFWFAWYATHPDTRSDM